MAKCGADDRLTEHLSLDTINLRTVSVGISLTNIKLEPSEAESSSLGQLLYFLLLIKERPKNRERKDEGKKDSILPCLQNAWQCCGRTEPGYALLPLDRHDATMCIGRVPGAACNSHGIIPLDSLCWIPILCILSISAVQSCCFVIGNSCKRHSMRWFCSEWQYESWLVLDWREEQDYDNG